MEGEVDPISNTSRDGDPQKRQEVEPCFLVHVALVPVLLLLALENERERQRMSERVSERAPVCERWVGRWS